MDKALPRCETRVKAPENRAKEKQRPAIWPWGRRAPARFPGLTRRVDFKNLGDRSVKAGRASGPGFGPEGLLGVMHLNGLR